MPGKSGSQPPIHDDAATNARGNGQEDEIALGFAEAILAPCSSLRIIGGDGGHAGKRTNGFEQRKAVGKIQRPAVERGPEPDIHDARYGNAGTSISALPVLDLRKERFEPLGWSAHIARGRHFQAVDNGLSTHERGKHLRAANVERQNRLSLTHHALPPRRPYRPGTRR